MSTNAESLAGFVLLKNMEYDLEAFQVQFFDDWKVELEGTPVQGAVSYELEGATIAILFVPMRRPDALEGCARNYSWEGSREAVGSHQSYVEFAILDCEDPLRRHVLYTMVAVSLMRQENAIGIYRYPTVHSAEEFIESSKVMKENDLPVNLWVFIGVYWGADRQTFSCYTYGMEAFGKEEMEILNCSAGLLDMYGFMQKLVKDIIGADHALQDGEVIAINSVEKVTVQRSQAAAFDGTSLKINYRNA